MNESLEKVKFIQEKFIVAQSRKKEYVDQKVGDIHFMKGAQVLLKVSPMKCIKHFGNHGKISPR